MAQFFFHLTSRDRVLVDRTGYDLPDLVEVRRRADGVMRRCLETGAVDGDWRNWLLHVTDEEDDDVFVLPFSDALGRPH